MNRFNPFVYLLILGTTLSQISFAQKNSAKDVYVVKPYEPVLSDAVKMNFLPRVSDTIKVVPNFDYSIHSSKVPTDFTVNPINAAKMVAEPIPRLYKSYLKLGLGNYLTPLLELNINSLRSSKYTIGAYFHHISSGGKVKLDNNQKVFAGYADNDASVFGERYFKNSTLSASIDFTGNTIYYYGYNPNLKKDTSLSQSSIRQDILHGGANLGLNSNMNDSAKLNYDARLAYHYTTLKGNHFEHAVNSSLFLRKVIDGNDLSANIGLDYYKPSLNVDSSYHTLFQLKPAFSRKSSDWRFSVGLNLTADIAGGSSAFKIFPQGILEFIAIERILIPYFGITGYVDANDYYSILQENPYINPDLNVKSSTHRLKAYGGIKGNLGSEISYHAKVEYSSLQDMYFFVNQAKDSLSLGNQFGVVYDDAQLLTYTGEFSYAMNERIYLRLSTVYNQYTMSKLPKPFHKDIFDIAFSGTYNLKDKIIAGAEIYYVGKRYAQSLSGKSVVDLNAVVDLNLSVEYRYTKMLSAFIKLNNIAASTYYRWNQYPSQRFNFMVGFSYAL
jgi:hypothetical protein